MHDGDELEVTSEDGRIVLTPVAERHPEIDAALAEALALKKDAARLAIGYARSATRTLPRSYSGR